MKKLTILLIALAITGTVSAQTNLIPREPRLNERPTENRQEIKDKVQEKRNELTEKRNERKIKIQEAKKDRIEKLTSNIAEKMQNAIVRLESFSTKIAEKIKNFEDRKIDVTESKALLETANKKLADTKAELAKTEIVIETLITSEEVSINDFKNIFETTKNSIKETRQAYVDVIASLKASINKERVKKTEDNSDENNDN